MAITQYMQRREKDEIQAQLESARADVQTVKRQDSDVTKVCFEGPTLRTKLIQSDL